MCGFFVCSDHRLGITQPHHARLPLFSHKKEIRAGKAELLQAEPRPSSCPPGEQAGQYGHVTLEVIVLSVRHEELGHAPDGLVFLTLELLVHFGALGSRQSSPLARRCSRSGAFLPAFQRHETYRGTCMDHGKCSATLPGKKLVGPFKTLFFSEQKRWNGLHT